MLKATVMVAFARWAWLAGALGIAGCDPSGQLCRDTALLLEERDRRCGWVGPGHDAYETLLGGDDCSQVEPVRDPDALVDACWPAIERSCSETPSLPAACDAQF